MESSSRCEQAGDTSSSCGTFGARLYFEAPCIAHAFGKLGVFGIYVTTAAAESVPVTGKYRRDPAMTSVKRPTYAGVLDVKTVLEAGFLGERLTRQPTSGRVHALAAEIERAGLDPRALAKILPAAWRGGRCRPDVRRLRGGGHASAAQRCCRARAQASRMSRCASSGPPQRATLTHFWCSRSL